MKVFWKIIKIASIVYAALFVVFFFDLDGKFLYYVWEPWAVKRYDRMKHRDLTDNPYFMTKDVSES